MKKIGDFFDKLEDILEGDGENRKRMEKGMDLYTSRGITGAFAFVILDLWMLIVRITEFDFVADDRYVIIWAIIAVVGSSICIHYLDKRVKAQESEELAEDLEDDIKRIALTVLIIAVVLFFILVWINIKK